jgi:hypothetical protein
MLARGSGKFNEGEPAWAWFLLRPARPLLMAVGGESVAPGVLAWAGVRGVPSSRSLSAGFLAESASALYNESPVSCALLARGGPRE